MDTYAIYLNDKSDEAWKKVRKKWVYNHILDDRLAFVALEKVTTTADIAEAVGIGVGEGDERLTGIVISMGAYNGFNDMDLWEWLGKVGKL